MLAHSLFLASWAVWLLVDDWFIGLWCDKPIQPLHPLSCSQFCAIYHRLKPICTLHPCPLFARAPVPAQSSLKGWWSKFPTALIPLPLLAVLVLSECHLPVIWWRLKCMHARGPFHDFIQSIEASYEAELLFGTRPLALLYRLTLATCAPTMTACTDFLKQERVQQLCNCGGEFNLEIHQNAWLSCTSIKTL